MPRYRISIPTVVHEALPGGGLVFATDSSLLVEVEAKSALAALDKLGDSLRMVPGKRPPATPPKPIGVTPQAGKEPSGG